MDYIEKDQLVILSIWLQVLKYVRATFYHIPMSKLNPKNWKPSKSFLLNTVGHWATACDKPRAQTIIPLTNIKTPVELYQGANFSGSLSKRFIAIICPIKSNKTKIENIVNPQAKSKVMTKIWGMAIT